MAALLYRRRWPFRRPCRRHSFLANGTRLCTPASPICIPVGVEKAPHQRRAVRRLRLRPPRHARPLPRVRLGVGRDPSPVGFAAPCGPLTSVVVGASLTAVHASIVAADASSVAVDASSVAAHASSVAAHASLIAAHALSVAAYASLAIAVGVITGCAGVFRVMRGGEHIGAKGLSDRSDGAG